MRNIAARLSVAFLAGIAAVNASAQDGAFGTAHSVVIVAASPEARWVVYCQPRLDTDGDGVVSISVGYHGDLSGDRMDAWLVSADGREVPIDDFVDVDPTGRYLAVIRDGRLLLIDTADFTTTDLSARGADARDDSSPLGGHRAGTFGAGRLLYLRERAITVRTLATGDETTIAVRSGELFRAWLDGEWARVLVVTEDTDGNGRLEWPAPRTSLGDRRCRGPIASYSIGGSDGDDVTQLVVPVGGGEPLPVPSFVAAFDDRFLMRGPDESLALVDVSSSVELAPAACRGQLLGIDPPRDQIVAVCADGAIRLFWPGGSQDVGTQRPQQRGDDLATTDRLLFLTDGSLLDLEARTVVATDLDYRPLVAGDRALVERRGRLVLWNLTTGEERAVGRSDEPYLAFVRAGSTVAAQGVVVDLARFQALGSYRGTALAVATNGRVLLAARESDVSRFELPSGPLHWVQPRAPRN